MNNILNIPKLAEPRFFPYLPRRFYIRRILHGFTAHLKPLNKRGLLFFTHCWKIIQHVWSPLQKLHNKTICTCLISQSENLCVGGGGAQVWVCVCVCDKIAAENLNWINIWRSPCSIYDNRTSNFSNDTNFTTWPQITFDLIMWPLTLSTYEDSHVLW